MTTGALVAQQIFDRARQYISAAGLDSEVNWHRGLDFRSFSEPQLLSELAWVILCSGFRESTVRRSFDHISLCYFDWESSGLIRAHGDLCVRAAMSSFRNEAKLRAIVQCADMIDSAGFERLKLLILRDPIAELQKFPFIGPITVWHLAKNVGCDVAKPDRHLVRLAANCGYDSVARLCEDVAKQTGEAVRVVDIIFWRYLADNPRAQ